MPTTTTAILVARPGPLREGLQALLSTIGSIGAIHLAAGSLRAIRLSIEVQPDLALLSDDLPGEQVWVALEGIKQHSPRTRRVLLVQDASRLEARRAALSDAVLMQGSLPEVLIRTLEALLAAGG